jgi:competence protein ComEA
MTYTRSELLTLAALLTIMLIGAVLVVPQLTGAADSPNAETTESAVDLRPPKEEPSEYDGSDEADVDGASLESSRALEMEGVSAAEKQEPGSRKTRKLVYVAGAVEQPGVVEIKEGTRVFEAVELAGGALEEAALGSINLAVPVNDGQMIYVPTEAELKEGQTREGMPLDRLAGAAGILLTSPVGPPEASTETAVDLNSAGIKELKKVPGLGPTLARRIITYRGKIGAFDNVEQLTAVNGIGDATLDELRDYVCVR